MMRKECKKKISKRVAVGILVTAVATVSIPVENIFTGGINKVYAEESESADSDYTYSLIYHSDMDNRASAIITAYNGSDAYVQVPESIDGYPVESIGVRAFFGNENVQEIILPDTVNNIDRQAFEGCTALEKITIPDGVSSIGGRAFFGCSSLENICLPDSIEYIGYYGFAECKALKEIAIPAGVTYIDELTFQNCESLSKVVLPEKLETICEYAFSGCKSLLEINIPESVNRIEYWAFYDTGIKTLKIPNEEMKISVCAFGDRLKKDDSFTIIGVKGSNVEKFAKTNFMPFKSLDGTYEYDYSKTVGCYDTALANYRATIDHLNEYYIEKYPDMAFDYMFGGDEDRRFFREVAADIIDKSPELSVPEAIYNWMNENISNIRPQYGYPMDVYNFRTADCLGNALLMCELLRSADIPAVVAYGYAGNTKKILDEVMIFEENLAGHAWVLAYYNNQWNLLDSGLNRIMSDEEKICSWYYTLGIENYSQVYDDEFNTKASASPVYFRDGKYVFYDFMDEMMERENGGWGMLVLMERVDYCWMAFYKHMTFVEDGTAVERVPGRGGWITDGEDIYYMKKDTSVHLRTYNEKDGKLYYFAPNAIDFTDLKGRYRTKYSFPVIDVGTEFNVFPVRADDVDMSDFVWESSDESVLKVNEDGKVLAVGTGGASLEAYIGNTRYVLFMYVDNFVTEISMENNLELKVGEEYTLELTANNESELFGNYIWESTDESVITVDDTGKVTALKEGVADVTVLYGDGSGLSCSCRVVVTSEDISIKGTTGDEGIYIEFGKDVVDEDTSLVTGKIEKDDAAYEEIGVKDDVEFEAFDITLVDKHDKVVQPNGKLKVRIPCPKGFKGHKCKVYHVMENGKFVDMFAVREGDFLVFETNHFSTYIVTEDKLTEGVQTANGDVNGDGTVNSTDAVVMQKYLAGYEDTGMNESAGDLNKDGDITSADAVLLLKYLAGYEGIID